MSHEGAPGFNLIGPVLHVLGPGERTAAGTFVVRFTPVSTDTRTASVTFTNRGDGDPARTNATLTLIGNGTTNPKPFNVLGCGPGEDSPNATTGNLLLLCAVLLLLRGRRLRNDRGRR